MVRNKAAKTKTASKTADLLLHYLIGNVCRQRLCTKVPH